MSYSCDLFFMIILIFITIINHVISLKQTHFFLEIFVKSSASGCCLAFASFFAIFSMVLLIKKLLIKKGCIPLRDTEI